MIISWIQVAVAFALSVMAGILINHYYFNTKTLLAKLSHVLRKKVFGPGDAHYGSAIKSKLFDSDAWITLINNIQKEVDEILDHQLKEKIPLIYNLVGEDFLVKLKPLIKSTLEEKAPKLMNEFLSKFDESVSGAQAKGEDFFEKLLQDAEPNIEIGLKGPRRKLLWMVAFGGALISVLSQLAAYSLS